MLSPKKGGVAMIRIYFVFEDPLDDAGINLSFADVATTDPAKAFKRFHDAADSGELWKALYPDEQDHPYLLINDKMSYLDISALPNESNTNTVLSM